MEIRRLREEDVPQMRRAEAVSFNLVPDENAKLPPGCDYLAAFGEDGTFLSGMSLWNFESAFCGTKLGAAGYGSIVTDPRFRRRGCIRQLISRAFEEGEKAGLAVSYLHPFSYSYYEKFGYRKATDKMKLTLPVSAIGAPRFGEARLLEGEDDTDYRKVYEGFSAGYQLSLGYSFFRRFEYGPTPYRDRRYTYLCYDGREPCASATFTGEGKTMQVSELLWRDAASLGKMLGFLRMFEGQYETVVLDNLPPVNPVGLFLGERTGVKTEIFPSMMARVLSVEKVLEANRGKGKFCLRVHDEQLPCNDGDFLADYTGERPVVTRVAGLPADVEGDISALGSVLLRCEMRRAEEMKVLGIDLKGNAEDFLESFSFLPAHIADRF